MTVRRWITPETLVNTTTQGTQQKPVVAELSNGNYVIAWYDVSTTPTSIKFQMYDAQGATVGTETAIGSANDMFSPSITALENGKFAISFTEEISMTDTDVFLVPGAEPESRRHQWRTLLAARAMENQCYVVGANRVGHFPQGFL